MKQRLFLFIGVLVGISLLMVVGIFVLEKQSDAFLDQYLWIFIVGTMVLLMVLPLVLMRRFSLLGGDRKKIEWLLTYGTPAKATIREIADTGITINDNPVVRMTLEVTPDFGAGFKAVVETPVSRIAIPRLGDVVYVRYDPQDPTKFMIVPSS